MIQKLWQQEAKIELLQFWQNAGLPQVIIKYNALDRYVFGRPHNKVTPVHASNSHTTLDLKIVVVVSSKQWLPMRIQGTKKIRNREACLLYCHHPCRKRAFDFQKALLCAIINKPIRTTTNVPTATQRETPSSNCPACLLAICSTSFLLMIPAPY